MGTDEPEQSASSGVGAVLVTGGAGYIGSHTVLELSDAGCEVVVIDDFSNGDIAAIPSNVAVYRGNVADVPLVRQVIRRHDVRLVMHFAGSVSLAESFERPLDYVRNNTEASRFLATTCVEAGVRRFIFSSSAAVYGVAISTPYREIDVAASSSPYTGSPSWTRRSCCASCLRRIRGSRRCRCATSTSRAPIRRGAWRGWGGGLIDRAIDAALGPDTALDIWGNDYDTRDGAGERDYIHVSDVAAIHLAAMRYLEAGGCSVVLNCGSGRGHTVLEVLAALEAIIGRPIPRRSGPRRNGDVPIAIGDVARLAATLGWRPRYDDLSLILRSALAWRGWAET